MPHRGSAWTGTEPRSQFSVGRRAGCDRTRADSCPVGLPASVGHRAAQFGGAWPGLPQPERVGASRGRHLPVMVWIHGGAFARGAHSIPTYDGSAFARDGVVLVGINYRLGVPGFAVLDGAPTNLGLRDQIAALEWVRDYVAVFGGNPDEVTVFGESSGGISVATLMASPAAGGLFHRAIVQSGSGAGVCSAEDARLVSAEVAASLGVPATAEAFAALDPEAVVAAQSAVALAFQADPDPQRWGQSVLTGGIGIMSSCPSSTATSSPTSRWPASRRGPRPACAAYRDYPRGVPALPGAHRRRRRADPDVLPLPGARYGWPPPPSEGMPRTARRRQRATLPAPSSPTRPSGSRPAAWPPPNTQREARCTSTSSGGPHRGRSRGLPRARTHVRVRRDHDGACPAGPARSSRRRDAPGLGRLRAPGRPGLAALDPTGAGRDDLDVPSRLVDAPRADELALWVNPAASDRWWMACGSRLWPSIRA